MNEKWNELDLKLFLEKTPADQKSVTTEYWTRHVKDLTPGEEIKWRTYSGMYRTPYDGEYKFTFIEAGDTIRIKAAGKTEEEIVFEGMDEWTSDWYEQNGWCHRLTLSVITSLYSVSELPKGVRTMQQTDHDAWDYAVRNGLI